MAPQHLDNSPPPANPKQEARARRFAHLLSVVGNVPTTIKLKRLWARGKKLWAYCVEVPAVDAGGYEYKEVVKRFRFTVK